MGERTCQFCRFGGAVEGLDAGRLVCGRSEAPTRPYKVVGCAETCDEWQLHGVHSFDPVDVAREDTRLIALTRGRLALVDAADYDELSPYSWHICVGKRVWYAAAWIDGVRVKMHRLVMGAPPGLCVDHIDHNGLNNTRRNLRLCTKAENCRNARPWKNGGSKYKGVSWHKGTRKFRAKIGYERKCKWLGVFEKEEDAARAYDKKAKELFEEFAYLNFPDVP